MRTNVTKMRAQHSQIRLELDLKASMGVSQCPIIRQSADAAEFFKGLGRLEREVLVSGALDCKCRLIHCSLLSVGSCHSASVRVGDAYQNAIRLGAMGILLIHNHPSGSLEASAEDYRLTKQAKQAGWLLGYPLLDHLIIARSGFRSLMPERMNAVSENAVATLRRKVAVASEKLGFAATGRG